MISYPPAGAGVHARRQSVGKPRGKEVNARMKAGPAEAGLRINGAPPAVALATVQRSVDRAGGDFRGR